MNQFDTYIAEFLQQNKEAALDKIGIITLSSSGDSHTTAEFVCQKKTATSPALINFIAEKTRKNKNLIASDLESHFAQVREFLNIGKNYEIPGVCFIKANNAGLYELLPYTEISKPVKVSSHSVKKEKRNVNISFIQIITFLIVVGILSGLGWQAYEFFSKNKTNSIAKAAIKNEDSNVKTNLSDTIAKNTVIDSSTASAVDLNDSINVKYIFETTASGLRARTRTTQLKGFGNKAGYDSFITNNTKFYNLYIIKPTKIADTLAVKDSLSKFLLRDIKIVIEPSRH